MNARRVMTWVIFWCSVALALGALAWVSVEVVALERREVRSRASAYRQEAIRRALWRLDSTMAPILAVEAARPSSAYERLQQSPFDDASWGKADREPGITHENYARRYFAVPRAAVSAWDAGAGLSSGRTQKQLSTLADTPSEAPPRGETELGGIITQSVDDSAGSDSDYEARSRVAQLAVQNAPPEPASTQRMNKMGRASESLAAGDAEPDAFQADDARSGPVTGDDPDAASPGTLTPRWVTTPSGTTLVLTREATIEGEPVVQGVELDWEALSRDLTASIDDVLPGATLVPSPSTQGTGGYRMATIPVALIPPPMNAPVAWVWSPAKVGLLVTWVAIVATIVAVGVVLRAAIVLSERRGRFVSAVTHELRTPLTTFRLYAQMLADGMVSDDQVRQDYLSTLKRESERLTGIVENVLEYARLSRVRPGKGKPAGEQTLSPGALVARFRPALARRLGQHNMDLVASLDLDAHQDRTLTIDPHAVERIMMNLIENACKYAAPGDDETEGEEHDSRVHLDVSVRDDMLELLVADHGPGIAPSEHARIFGEFQRGRRGLGNARSGLGLGLALSRGLAREMGGDLRLVRRRGHGAEFLLTIPLDEMGSGK